MKNRIKELRVNNNVTLRKLAQDISMNHSNISYYENDKKEISLQAAIRIADYFNVSLDYLLCRKVKK